MTDYFYNQLEELASQQTRKSRSNSKDSSDEDCTTSQLHDSHSDSDAVKSVPDQNCREVIKEDHPFLKYAVKLGYELEMAQDALSRLGASATTDSLLKAVLYSYAALNPSRRNRNNRRHFNNRHPHHHHMSNGKPFPSYMITQDSYQRFNGHHPDLMALRSALSQGPTTTPPCMKPISPPNAANNGVYTSQTSDLYDLNPSLIP